LKGVRASTYPSSCVVAMQTGRPLGWEDVRPESREVDEPCR